MASAANANLNAVRETMDGKDSDRGVWVSIAMYHHIHQGNRFFYSPAGNLPLAEHWLGHGVSVHLCETV